MKQIFKLTFLAISILLTSCNTSAQQIDNYSTKIESLLKSKTPREFNGVVYVQQNGKTKYAKAYGIADVNKKTLLKIDDKFSTMSIAKQITATLILQEVEKGTIDLHTPIRSYLPDFQYSWADSITVHQLLNHTSGLYADELKPNLKQKPNLGFSYSNVGYSVLGKILEKQSGKTFETLVTALFKKCKMKNSYYPNKISHQALTKGSLIKKDGTTKQFEKISFTPDQYWGSHLIVTASDLAKWNECLHNGNLLKPSTYKLMTSYSISNAHPLFGKTPIGYGYGLRINDKADIYEIGHTGFHPAEGFTAVNLYYPITKTSIIVMENQANENFDIAYYYEQEIRKIVTESGLLGSNELKDEIRKITSTKNGDIGVSIITDTETLEINGSKQYPMLSTFKFPIALTILNKVEKGELSIQQQIFIKKEELLENTFSPFREKYPDGNISISLEEAIKWMVMNSDNNMTDILLRLIGGTDSVSKFINDENFIIKNNEEDMHKNWDAQFVNKTTPLFFTQLLRNFSEGKILNQEHTNWLYQTMLNSQTGVKRLKGKLPNVAIAQRAGTSFTNDKGITGAINNIGIIELPNKQKMYIAVLIHNTSEQFSTGEEIIADIAKVSYEHYAMK